MRGNRIQPGERFGRLAVVEGLPERYRGSRVFLCLCDCGETTRVISGSLRIGNTRSCACLRREVVDRGNGDRRTQVAAGTTRRHHALYSTWHHMKARCLTRTRMRSTGTAAVESASATAGSARVASTTSSPTWASDRRVPPLSDGTHLTSSGNQPRDQLRLCVVIRKYEHGLTRLERIREVLQNLNAQKLVSVRISRSQGVFKAFGSELAQHRLEVHQLKTFAATSDRFWLSGRCGRRNGKGSEDLSRLHPGNAPLGRDVRSQLAAPPRCRSHSR